MYAPANKTAFLRRVAPYIAHVDTARIKALLEGMSQEEQMFISAYLRHKLRGRTPAEKLDLERRMKEMDDGNKVTLEEAWRLHRALEEEGL